VSTNKELPTLSTTNPTGIWMESNPGDHNTFLKLYIELW